ncbi:MAG: Hpt domain-containing protein [Telmatospirillum sp.]|nr:Hpt domain-containing protein [Telmatospirillum sp.]
MQHALVDQERLAILVEALGDKKLAELFITARQSVVESADELKRCWVSGDTRQAGRAAHRLAGVAANFGFSALGTIARNIERDCLSSGDGKSFAASFDDILAASLATTLDMTKK